MAFKKFLFQSCNGVGLLSLSLMVFGGCSLNQGAGRVYAMGEAAKAGSLTYTVVETEWKQMLDGSMGARLPKNRFLVVNLSIANSKEAAVSVPLLALVDAKGVEYREEDKGEGVTSWFGYLRQVGPAEPLHGKILFDVPPGGFQLRISSGGTADMEVTSLVNLPLGVEPPPVKPDDPAAVLAETKQSPNAKPGPRLEHPYPENPGWSAMWAGPGRRPAGGRRPGERHAPTRRRLAVGIPPHRSRGAARPAWHRHSAPAAGIRGRFRRRPLWRRVR